VSQSRRWTRIKVDFRVRLCWELEGQLQREVVRATSLAAGGMAVLSPSALPVDTSVELEFMLPGTGREFRLSGKIRSGRGFRYGLEFLNVSDEERHILSRFCGDNLVEQV